MNKKRKYPQKNIIGNVYGRLTVISFQGYKVSATTNKEESWHLCKCMCGKLKEMKTSSILNKNNVSCGCWRIDNIIKLNKGMVRAKRPCSQETKGKIRQKLLGRSPSNKGIKRDKPPHNKLPTKIVLCKCCGIPFEVCVTSKLMYAKGHYQQLIKSGGNPCSRDDIKEKIRNTLIATYKEKPEILENRKISGKNQYSGSYSSIEKLIADALNSLGVFFYHNRKVGKYFPDFLIFHDVIIECDGGYWHKDQEHDRKRDAYLMERGFYIFRLSEKRIIEDAMGCVISIISILYHMGHRHASLFESKINHRTHLKIA